MKEHELDKNKYIPILMEIGQIMIDDDTDCMDLELTTPGGTVIFEITMRIEEVNNDD